MTSSLVKKYEQDSILAICINLKEKLLNGKAEEVKFIAQELEEAKEEAAPEDQFFILSTLAKYFRRMKNYDKAGNYGRQAIRLTKQVNEEHIKMIIDAHLEYAALEREYGQLSAARMELAKLLAYLDLKNVQDPFAYGALYMNLGKLAIDEENIESALTQLEKAYNHYVEAVPKTHPAVLQTVELLSDTYIKVENYTKAIQYQQEVLAEYIEQEDRLAEVRIRLKISEIYFYIDLRDARKMITETMKSIPEDDQPETKMELAKALLMLAEIDENLESYPRSINYYKRALGELENVYPENHFLIVFAYSKIGTISMKTFKLRQAKEHLEKGLSLAGNFPRIRQQFLYALGKIYSDEKSYDLALEMFQSFLETLEKDGRQKSLAYGNAHQAIAFNYLVQKQLEDAKSHYEKALAAYQSLPNCKEEKGLTMIRLAYCYENGQFKQIKKAEELYESGFKLIEKTRHPDLLEEALAGIIDFYTRNRNDIKRRKYENKLVKLHAKSK